MVVIRYYILGNLPIVIIVYSLELLTYNCNSREGIIIITFLLYVFIYNSLKYKDKLENKSIYKT